MNDSEDNGVQYYCEHTKECKHTQISKAEKLLEYDCIRYLKDVPAELAEFYPGARNVFVCLPINTWSSVNVYGRVFLKKPYKKDYNSTTYFIFKKDDTFECNCQGFQSKAKKGEIIQSGANCSHVLALYMAFKNKIFSDDKESVNT